MGVAAGAAVLTPLHLEISFELVSGWKKKVVPRIFCWGGGSCRRQQSVFNGGLCYVPASLITQEYRITEIWAANSPWYK